MKHLLAAASAVALLATSAHADIIRGVQVTLMNPPTCVEPNPAPAQVHGDFYAVLRGTKHEPEGVITDPFYYLPALAGSPYSALIGAPGNQASAVYAFAQPQTDLTVFLGSWDPYNFLVFRLNGVEIARLNGNIINERTGQPHGHSGNLHFHLYGGKSFDAFEVSSTGVAAEYSIDAAGCE